MRYSLAGVGLLLFMPMCTGEKTPRNQSRAKSSGDIFAGDVKSGDDSVHGDFRSGDHMSGDLGTGNGDEPCTTDENCPPGEVCEPGDPSCTGATICVPGCHKSDDCESTQTCLEVFCLTCPCPGICT